MTAFRIALKKVSPEQLFMGSVLLVNGGNYLYNLLLGRLLGPEVFAEAALHYRYGEREYPSDVKGDKNRIYFKS